MQCLRMSLIYKLRSDKGVDFKDRPLIISSYITSLEKPCISVFTYSFTIAFDRHWADSPTYLPQQLPKS